MATFVLVQALRAPGEKCTAATLSCEGVAARFSPPDLA